ncbi:hypothetical protein [Effusibacillus pohliae]|uniref:hypothetical protein n=1 Tax=Effusibacillus pohliae TaxID=232270 RepID=UPI00037EE839|nr:hypothetical protein [Effusibacillus pohliae]
MVRFFRSPLGLTLTAATVILALSPEARQAARKLAVKGTVALLDLMDQVRSTATGAREQLSSLVEEMRLVESMGEESQKQTEPVQS